MASTLSTSRAAPSFRVHVLGPFALERDGSPIDVARWQPRVVTLFKLLATVPGYRRSRDEIVDLLWPDATPEAGAGNLRMVIHRLRHALSGTAGSGPSGDPSPVLSEHGWVALNPAYAWELDLEQFERLTMDPAGDIAALEEAARLYRGEPLAEDRYEDWAVPIREGAQRRWNAVCLRLAQLYRTRGLQEEAALWLERLLESDPLHEVALQQLLSILGDLGRRTEALRRYRQFEQRLSEEIGVPPESETLALVARLEGYPGQTTVPPAPDRQIGQMVPVIPRYPLVLVGPLLGREAELAELLRALPADDGDPARSVRPRLLLLAAEAGVGKTRMLAEVAWRAREMGMLTLASGCYEQESRLPYGPIHDALADYVRTQSEAVLRAKLKSALPELAQVVPEVRTRLGAVDEAVGSDTEDQRLAIFTAVSLAFEQICQGTRLVLLLDDLHWADDGTLQLLHFLLRQPSLHQMLIVGAYRQEEASENPALLQLAAELDELRHRDRAHGYPAVQRAQVIPLDPLQEQEVGALLEGHLQERCSGSLVRSLYSRSGGNPFFALQMLRLLEQEMRLEYSEDGWKLRSGAAIGLPAEVRETVARRLRRLEPDEREALALGAMLGREFSFPALEAMWDGDERSLFAALDAAQASHVLGETESGYTFRHPLLRDVVYERTPAQRKTRLHRRAGAVLEMLYGDRRAEHATEIAWHALRGRNQGQAVRYSILAGERAASLYAYGEAEQHYRTALDLLENVEEPADYAEGEDGAERAHLIAEVREKLGALYKTVGRYAEAIELLDRAVQEYAAVADLEGQRRAEAHIGRVYLAMGALDEGLARLTTALDHRGGESASSGLAALHLSLAFLLFKRGRYAEQLKAAETAAELARSSGDLRLLVEAELVRAYALPFSGRPASAAAREFQAAMAEVVRLADEVGDSPTLSRALCALGPYQAERGDLDAARRSLDRALELAERLGDQSRIAFVTSTCGLVAFWRGEWDEAQALFERALAVYRELDALAGALSPLFGLGAVAMARGDWETGERYLEEHIRNAQRAGDSRWLHLVSLTFAERDLLEGRPENARRRIEQFRAHPGLSEDALLELLPTLARAHLQMGDVAGADRIAADTVRRAREADARMLVAEALRVRGAVLSAQRLWEEAEQELQEALSLSESMPSPYAAGRTLHDYGTMLVRRGMQEIGEMRLEEALKIFQRLGATPYAKWTEQALMKTQKR